MALGPQQSGLEARSVEERAVLRSGEAVGAAAGREEGGVGQRVVAVSVGDRLDFRAGAVILLRFLHVAQELHGTAVFSKVVTGRVHHKMLRLSLGYLHVQLRFCWKR